MTHNKRWKRDFREFSVGLIKTRKSTGSTTMKKSKRIISRTFCRNMKCSRVYVCPVHSFSIKPVISRYFISCNKIIMIKVFYYLIGHSIRVYDLMMV